MLPSDLTQLSKQPFYLCSIWYLWLELGRNFLLKMTAILSQEEGLMPSSPLTVVFAEYQIKF